jgi:hypothetical protein
LSIRLDAVFQAEELPAGISDLDATLANVDADSLTHLREAVQESSARELARGEWAKTVYQKEELCSVLRGCLVM